MIAVTILRSFNNAMLSKPKLEKVVKPPNIPITTNSLNASACLYITYDMHTPMRKHPMMFAANVGHGNPVLTGFIAAHSRYLQTAPIAPPEATNSNVFTQLR